MKNPKKLAIIVILGLIVILAGIFLTRDSDPLKNQEVSMEEPINVALDFYDSWAAASRATSTDPYKEELHKSPILSQELREKLKNSQDEFENGTDPVLCQTAVPQVITARPSYQLDEEAQVLILSRDEGLNGQSVATLKKLNEGWYISNIECSAGEFGEDREFTFDKDGYVLKSPELEGLYFIFAENGVFGNAAPIVFSPESACTDLDGNTSVCNVDSFGEKTKAIVRGQMSETGVDVQQLELVKGDLSFE